MNFYRTRFACIDPGLRGCGVSVFFEGEVEKAAYVKNPVETGEGFTAYTVMATAVSDYLLGHSYDKLIIEHPRVYPGSAQQKGDLNDLLSVVAVGSAIAATLVSSAYYYGDIETVYPSDWKGNTPKEVMTDRIRRALASEELSAMAPCAASLKHNVYDAIGIGLWKLKRINQRVIHNE